MTRYRPFVDAVQWTGTNVTEIRQFVRASGGVINDAVIVNNVLMLRQMPDDELRPVFPIEVQVTDWVVISAGLVTAIPNDDFVVRYELDI